MPLSPLSFPNPYHISLFSITLPDASGLLEAIDDVGNFDLRQGNRNEILPLLSDQLPLRNELSQLLSNFTANDLFEAVIILLNFHDHKSFVGAGFKPARKLRSVEFKP
jgi:hypothetical protein